MPSAFVTGATGFIGVNLVERLCAAGWAVTALHRPGSEVRLRGCPQVTLREGDVTDPDAVWRAIPSGVDVVFHLAADTNMWAPNNARQRRTNVEGTRSVVSAAVDRGARRFVQMSSVAAFAPRDGDRLVESMDRTARGHWIHYFRTKWEADEVVREEVTRGLSATFVHPGNVMGPHDARNWSRMFSLIAQRDVPGAPPGGAPWCHVRSLADFALIAAERGEVGASYLVGDVHAGYPRVFETIAEMVGAPPPRRLPRAILRTYGRWADWWSRWTRSEPHVTPEIAYLSSIDFSADCSRAKELGYRECSLQEMLSDTYEWLVRTPLDDALAEIERRAGCAGLSSSARPNGFSSEQ